ncbi:hypothetical protein O0I10_000797 [Lichtheimia ornata]|uniref:Glutamate carboxypeptidase n=1 Tax=Lichtheimia ornata TaxID=688661 RepID=A0AAD8DHW7_9FUNG|nr:uncharacterized protein O0I10_000797 [Lichtheimia ornata]KAJ8663554.1 hypothetical protein O0I10_000797 [Lichtheimia ornata]
MPEGYVALPQDEDPGQTSKPTSFIDRAKQWWHHQNNDERAPLLDRKRMTLQPPKRKTLKVIIVTVVIILALLAVGVVLALWIDKDDNNQAGKQRPLSETEQLMLDFPSKDNIRDYLKYYTSEAHLAGTEADKRRAEWTRDKFIEFGISDSTIETYYPLLNYPVSRRFGIVSGPKEFQYEAELREDPVEEDPTSHDPDVVPTFHGYSKNGTALGRVVYANYGRVEDFQFLVDHGIDLNGTIALMRYGGAFRGLKVRAAQVFGCAGALIYSDPIDDGPIDKEGYPHVNPAKGYPEGPWRSPSSAQRGSVQFLSLTAGDPLTPGYAATKDAPRLNPEDVEGLAKIPSLPLSYRDALPLLKAMEGHGVRGEHDWAGGLEEVSYFSGPTEGDAYLENIVDNKITPIWNTIGVIEGSEDPDRVIVLGNHRDAWVYGAVDPNSGSSSMIELARSFGELLKTGWRPARTIILASWDAEEYGLVGSTEWVEDHDWLKDKAVTYINVDTAVSGPHFVIQASPSLNQLIYEVTSLVQDPRTGGSVYDAWAELTNRTLTPSPKPYIGQLGSGSDFVPFLDHLGISSISLAFTGDYGVYHSNYDSFHWMEKFGDPGFHYHATMTKIWGLLALRLADSPILPLHPVDYADALDDYVDYLVEFTTSLSTDGADSSRSFPLLRKAVHKLKKIAVKFEKNLQSLESQVYSYSHLANVPKSLTSSLRKVNDRLAFFERGLIDPEGIQNREWFKHIAYAPGLWTGYSSQVFPAITDALEDNDEELVKHKEERAAQCIRGAADSLR